MGFADNLKRIRLEKEISQSELARRIGVSRSVISNYEAGLRSQISKPYITAIASALGVTENELTGNGTLTPVDMGDGVPTSVYNPPAGDPWHIYTDEEIVENRKEHMQAFDSLTVKGQFAATDIIKVLADMPELKKRDGR